MVEPGAVMAGTMATIIGGLGLRLLNQMLQQVQALREEPEPVPVRRQGKMKVHLYRPDWGRTLCAKSAESGVTIADEDVTCTTCQALEGGDT